MLLQLKELQFTTNVTVCTKVSIFTQYKSHCTSDYKDKAYGGQAWDHNPFNVLHNHFSRKRYNYEAYISLKKVCFKTETSYFSKKITDALLEGVYLQTW